MSAEKNMGVMTPELQEELDQTLKRYREHGLNFSEDLDRWAGVYGQLIKKRGLTYSKDSDITERWLVLRAALQKSEKEKELESLLERVRTYAQKIEGAIRQGSDAYMEALRLEPNLHPDTLEEPLSDALDSNPELEPLVQEIRKSLKNLRQLTC